MGTKYDVDEHFFDEWSDSMAYVLGYLYADGSLEDSPSIRGKYVRVTSTDGDRTAAIKRRMRSQHRISIEIRGGNRMPLHTLRIGSTALYERLLQIGMTPRKSHTMKFPNIPKDFVHMFVRGYFDGDGGVYIELRPNGSLKKLRVVLTSGSKSFLEKLHLVFKDRANVIGRGLYRHGSTNGTYQLRYSTNDSMNIGNFIYAGSRSGDLIMSRKYAIFTRYLELHAAVAKPRLRLSGHMAK